MKLVDKDTLVAEIEKLKEIYCYDTKTNSSFVAKAVINSINNAINSLEVKEIDLEEEIDKYIKDNFTVDREVRIRLGIVEKDYIYSLDRGDMLALVEHFINWQKEL